MLLHLLCVMYSTLFSSGVSCLRDGWLCAVCDRDVHCLQQHGVYRRRWLTLYVIHTAIVGNGVSYTAVLQYRGLCWCVRCELFAAACRTSLPAVLVLHPTIVAAYNQCLACVCALSLVRALQAYSNYQCSSVYITSQ